MGLISELSSVPGASAGLPAAWERACTGEGVPLPPTSTNYFDAVRDSTSKFIGGDGQALVKVNTSKVQQYVDELDAAKFDKYVKHVKSWSRSLPLVFDNQAQNLNLIAILDLLQIGSGFRRELHEAVKRGASDTINFGCMSMHISQTPLDARGLQALTLGDISRNFGIPLLGKERPMSEGNTAVMISEASELRPLAEIILGILQDTGRRLEQSGFASFADFIIKTCVEKPTAANLVQKLVTAFPSLRDAASIGGQPVYLFKKAQLIAYDICQKFGKEDSMFGFPDIGDMTLFADNVVPAVVQHHGLIDPCSSIRAKIASGQELTLQETTAMRAASIVAAQLVVDCANSPSSGFKAGAIPVNQATLDNFWWYEGKEPELRSIQRLQTMFKKPFHTKTRALLRSSSCRHLIQESKELFPAAWEQAEQAENNSSESDGVNAEGPMPDKLQTAKFTSHIGDRGEIFYNEAGDPLWLKVEAVAGGAALLVPTVYTLWRFPMLLPVLWTTSLVIPKLIGGADLMVPGLLIPREGLPDLKKGALVAICCPGNAAAQAVGVLNLDTQGLHSVAGAKGKAVLITHTYMDHLWGSGNKQPLPTTEFAGAADLVHIGDDSDESNNSDNEHVLDGVEQKPSDDKPSASAALELVTNEGPSNLTDSVVDAVTPDEMDELLMDSLRQIMATVLDDAHAAELLPINASTIYSTYMVPNVPRGLELDIKKSSHKKLAKFLKAAEKHGLIKLKDIRGELHIKSFNRAHKDMAEFTPYVIGSTKKEKLNDGETGRLVAVPGQHGSELDMIRVIELLKPSSALAPLFDDVNAQTNTGYFSRQQARTVLEDYIKGRRLVDAQNPRMVKLDHRLCDGLLTKEEYSKLSSYPRDKLQARLQERMTLYTQVVLPGGPTPVKIGNPPCAEIVCEKKMGSKAITRVSGLEPYGIDPSSLAKELRTACASSTTVDAIPGKKSAQMVLVQGHHIVTLTKLLEQHRLPVRLISVVDKSGRAKAKKVVNN
ncbi:hypothetical protein GGI17_001452 [Coemansia sp. S146]|nr:hypothetical protein GGI17_001452 [Coemansia sp. S146]